MNDDWDLICKSKKKKITLVDDDDNNDKTLIED